jgi:hypothetical protein
MRYLDTEILSYAVLAAIGTGLFITIFLPLILGAV